MKLSKLFYVILFVGIATSCSNEKKGQLPYQDQTQAVENRVKDLLSRMTIEEKIHQMDMYWGKEVADMGGHEAIGYSEEKIKSMLGNVGAGSIHDFYPLRAEIANQIQKYAIEKTRLGIPVMFIEEGLHGYSGLGSTTFPIPLQLAAAWDTSLVHRIGRVIATETRAHGVDMILGPVLCLPHDPRWGRVEETYGEDPYLAAMNGVAMVKGLQGRQLSDNDAVISEPKHFAVHGIPEAGSNTAPVTVGEREARSTFLYVFEKAVKEGGAMGIMAAYHEFDGIPCVDNHWMLTDVLRKEWGFKGFVLSDLGAIKMSLENHKVASDTSDALAQTLKAGMNMQFYDFDHAGFEKAIKKALESKLLTEEDIDKAVGDVLKVKFLLGLFDRPYTDTTLVSKVFHSRESQELALKAAQKSICLLKNENNVLPIGESIKKVAVIGSLATSTYLGGYSNEKMKSISILEGLKERAGDQLAISFEKGYDSEPGAQSSVLLQKAVNLAKSSQIAIVVLGEDTKIVGEGKDRSNIDLDENQLNLIKAIQATGRPVAVVLFNGRPLTINWVAAHVPAIVEAWFAGETGGLAVADVLLGKINPSGKLPMTFPRSMGQVPFYYNHKPTSQHRYVDEVNTPLFPFGLGLSYTTFDYADMKITPATIKPDESAVVSLKVTNTGKRDGDEVVQLYIRDEISSVTTPGLALKGFQRISLKAGASGTVSFTLTPEHLSLWNREMKRVVEPGTFKVKIGSSSADIRLEGTLKVL